MDLKGEVSQKIKSAIKAKLVELGQNVDDELPDYIMVMIANKRTKSQMDSDLSLFLGSHSDQFTSWLHQVLNRLKEVTLSTTSKGETQSKAKKRSQEEPELETLHKKQKRGTEEKKKVKDDKRKKKDDKLLKDDSKKKKRKHHDKEKKKEDKNGKQDKDKNKGELVKVDDEKGKPLDESLDKQEISVKELKDTKTEELQRKSENHNPLKKPAEEALPDYESDEEILQIGLDDEKPDNFTILETTEVEEKAPVEPVKELIQASSPPKEPEVQNRLIKLKRSVIPKAMEPIECNQTKEMEKPIKTMARVRPSIMSRLGSIVQPDEKPNRIIRQSTSPEGIRKPSLHSVPSSIIKVKARPRPITSNQATKTLIMKAVVDATKSIISAEKAVAKPVSTDEEIKKPRSIKDRLGYRIQSHEVNQIQDNDVIDVRTEERQNKMKEIFRKIKSQLPTGKSESQVVVNLYNSDLSDLPKVLQDEDMEYEIEYEEEETEDTEETIVEETIEEEMVASPVPTAKVEPVVPKVNERCRNWPWCTYGKQCRYIHPSKSCIVFPGCPFGSRCLNIHPKCRFDLGCKNPDCPFTHSGPRTFLNGPPKKLAPIPAVSTYPGSFPSSQSSSVPACKFFPNCINPSCPFFHPKICRYGLACTRPDCTFTHPVVPKATHKPVISQNQKWIAPNLK